MNRILIAAFLFFGFISSRAQDTAWVANHKPKKENPFSTDRLFTGGNLGLLFGTVTIVEISPLLGYHFTDHLAAGVGATYLHYADRINNYSTNVYGGRVFGRYYMWENLFLHAEAEELNGEWIYNNDRFWVLSLPVGFGYRQPLGDFAAFTFMVLYNLNDNEYSPYQSPFIIRAGFNIGL
jgi:hypothetical protein